MGCVVRASIIKQKYMAAFFNKSNSDSIADDVSKPINNNCNNVYLHMNYILL